MKYNQSNLPFEISTVSRDIVGLERQEGQAANVEKFAYSNWPTV
jgi:hypothetical protein